MMTILPFSAMRCVLEQDAARGAMALNYYLAPARGCDARVVGTLPLYQSLMGGFVAALGGEAQ